MTYVINVKDIIGAVILCAMCVVGLVLFAITVIGEKVREYKRGCEDDKKRRNRS